MKKTVIEIVQDILTDMSSDEVNSISDTPEAERVANVVKSVYEAMTSSRNWPHQKRTTVLEPYSDGDYPVHMLLNENCKELVSVYYNNRKRDSDRLYFKPVEPVDNHTFLERVNARNTDSDNVAVVIDPTGIPLQIYNDRHPRIYTSFDDGTLVFDGYVEELGGALAKADFQAIGYIQEPFVMEDDWVPDLPAEAFAFLVEEVRSTAMFRVGDRVDGKSEQEAKRQRAWLSRKSWTAQGGLRFPNFGRNSTYNYSNSFRAQGPKETR